MVVVDSIEGITSRYDLPVHDFVAMLQKDLVEGVNTNIVFISEESTLGPEDYIVDGVVNLNYKIEDSKRLRIIYLNKLRGIGIKKSSYCYTLNSGRFKSFLTDCYEKMYIGKWEAVPNKPGLYSTGIEGFDALLGGGIKPGAFFNIEIDKDIPHEYYSFITNPLILNFISHNLDLLIMPLPGTSLEYYIDHFKRWIPEKDYSKKD
jgi:hypothetical protein